jgi:hypothetical protein
MHLANKCKFLQVYFAEIYVMNNFLSLHSDGVLPKLADAATQQVFKPWELSDNLYKIKLDLAAVQPEVLHIYTSPSYRMLNQIF